MKKYLIIVFILFPFICFAQKVSDLKFVDAQELTLINKGFEDTALDYSRLPASMKGNIRKAVWDLGLNSAGLAVRFSTDSKCIGARWTLLNNFKMAHMANTGVQGLDLYTLEKGKWIFVGTAQPRGKESQNIFIRNTSGKVREYMAYLPLYDGVEKLSIGIDSTATISKSSPLSALSGQAENKIKPIVVYGTSITQGGCASRPGMAYPAQMSRALGCEVINLGFSGNARLDLIMAQEMSKIDASIYILDNLANCTSQIVKDSAMNFISTLAETGKDIYMLDQVAFPIDFLDEKQKANDLQENQAWYDAYLALRNAGYNNIHFIKTQDFIGTDSEATVDGNHFTDLGFSRMTKNILKHIKL